jgi:hypothetical protein
MTNTTPEAAERARVSTYADRAAARLQRMLSHDDMGKVYGEAAMREDIKAVLAERAALAAQEGGGERVTSFEGRFEELLDIGLEERRKWIKEMEANGSDVTIADRPLAGLIVALRAALRAAQEGK